MYNENHGKCCAFYCFLFYRVEQSDKVYAVTTKKIQIEFHPFLFLSSVELIFYRLIFISTSSKGVKLAMNVPCYLYQGIFCSVRGETKNLLNSVDLKKLIFFNLFFYFILGFQLADAKDVMEGIRNIEGVRLPVLTPNMKVGLTFGI